MNPKQVTRALNYLLKRWSEVSQNIHVDGKDISLKPHYISLSFREMQQYGVDISEGGVKGEPDELNILNGFTVKTLIGDRIQGYGQGRTAGEDLPENIRSLKRIIDEKLDGSVKLALADYLTNIAKNVVFDAKNFKRMSQDEANIYADKFLKREPISEDIIKRMIKWSKNISKHKYIVESGGGIYKSYQNRFFVDTEGREIALQSCLSDLYLTAALEHQRGFQLQHIDSLNFNSHYNLEELEKAMVNFNSFLPLLRNAETIDGGVYPVIFSPEAVGTLFHEAFGAHLISGRYIMHGVSTTFKDKLGKQILPEFITVVDDPQLKDAYGFYRFDEEGIPSKRLVLVENGILKTYLHDRESAAHFKTQSNGRSRMEWVLSQDSSGRMTPTEPEPRIGNLDIVSKYEVSDDQLVDIMRKYCKDTGKEFGIYIESGAGQVDIINGEFQLFPSKAWKIYSNGKKKEIINFSVIGHPYNLLNNIAITGNTYRVQRGRCGAGSGYVPTQERAPAAFIPEVTIESHEPFKLKKRLIERL